MKNQSLQKICCAAILIAFLLISISIIEKNPLIPGKTEHPSINNLVLVQNKNYSVSQLPIDLRYEVRRISQNNQFSIHKWEFDPTNRNQVFLYVSDIRNTSIFEEYQGKQVGNYTIRLIHDTEFETSRSEVELYLNQLMKNPDYQIATFSMVTDTTVNPPEYNVELWCYKTTPENQKLDHMIIKGWKILVFPAAPLPPQK